MPHSFSKESCASDNGMRHLKRVYHRPNPDGSGRKLILSGLLQIFTIHLGQTLIALCAVADATHPSLLTDLAAFHPDLIVLNPVHLSVPSTPARTQEMLRIKSAIWPTIYAPLQVRPMTSQTWSFARQSWVAAGVQRVLSLAQDAKTAGELPVAVYCTSAPESLWTKSDVFIPPTPGLRAASHDTRISEGHPLRHATLNCIASIARLRTVPPFSTLQPTRNGADYLLTSLSLFVTHEPCIMCCMALLHSRVREVFYVYPMGPGGGFEGTFGIHGRKDLNHRFEVWQWTGGLSDEVKASLTIEQGVAI